MQSSLALKVDNIAEGGWLNGLMTFLSGMSIVLAFAPFNYWYLVFPGLIWLVLPLQNLTIKQSLYRGLYFFMGFYGAGISWIHISIHRFGNTPLPLSIPLTLLLVFLLALFLSLSVVLLNRYCSKLTTKSYFLIALPLCWIFVEWLANWFLTGFPWLSLGHSQVDSLFSPLIPVIGSVGISYLLLLITGSLALIIRQGKKALKISIPIIGMMIVCIVALSDTQWVKPTEKTLSLSIIQPSIAQERKWLPSETRRTLDYFKDVTETLDTELVIWPEGAIPALARQVRNYLALIDYKASDKSQAVLTGVPIKEGDKYFNATIMLGKGEGRYYKQHLVPFGEYVPLESYIRGILEVFNLPMSSFSSGPADQPLMRVGDWNIAMAICYEVVFQAVVADRVDGADVLMTLSNDAWFGESIGSYQHLAIARMRAIENGLPMVRGTNDGISAIIDHQGQVLKRMEKFEIGVLEGSITAVNGSTPFRDLGPHFIYLILIVIPGLVVFYLIRKSPKPD